MEATALMRFAYATLAMRQGWENKGASVEAASGGGDDAAPPAQAPQPTQREFRSDETGRFHSEAKEEATGDAVGFLVPVLEVVLSAQMAVASGGDLDDSIAGLLGEMCELARSVGAFADMVDVLITMLLDVDDSANEELLRGISEIILQLCFETHKSNEMAFTPTIYYDDVLAQIDETLSALLEVAAPDALAAHGGVRCLADTHAIILSHFESLSHYGGAIV